MNETNMESIAKLLNELKSDIYSFKEELKSEISDIKVLQINNESKLKDQEKRIDSIEKELRRKNVIIHGFKEEKYAKYSDLERNVLKIINNKINIELKESDVDCIKRIGKFEEGYTRPVQLIFMTWKKKIEVMKNKRKLKGTNLFIPEDFPPKILEIRKKLNKEMIEARDQGKYATLRYDKLIVKEFSPRKQHVERNIMQDRMSGRRITQKRELSNSPNASTSITKVDLVAKKNRTENADETLEKNGEKKGNKIEEKQLLQSPKESI